MYDKVYENLGQNGYRFANKELPINTTNIEVLLPMLLGGLLLLLFGRHLLILLGILLLILLGKVLLLILGSVRRLLPGRLLVIFLSIYCGYFSAGSF